MTSFIQSVASNALEFSKTSVGAVIVGQFGASALLKVGGSLFGAYHVHQILNETKKYLFVGGIISLIYYGATQYMENYCANFPQDHKCEILGYVNCTLAITSAIYSVGLMSKAFYDLLYIEQHSSSRSSSYQRSIISRHCNGF